MYRPIRVRMPVLGARVTPRHRLAPDPGQDLLLRLQPARLLELDRGLDRDKDGIACEKAQRARQPCVFSAGS